MATVTASFSVFASCLMIFERRLLSFPGSRIRKVTSEILGDDYSHSDFAIFDFCLGVRETSADAALKCKLMFCSAVAFGPVVPAPLLNVEPGSGTPSLILRFPMEGARLGSRLFLPIHPSRAEEVEGAGECSRELGLGLGFFKTERERIGFVSGTSTTGSHPAELLRSTTPFGLCTLSSSYTLGESLTSGLRAMATEGFLLTSGSEVPSMGCSGSCEDMWKCASGASK